MKSMEKLRKVVADSQGDSIGCALVDVYMCKDAMSVSNAEVMEALGLAVDEIEQELEEKYVELPKDANGAPIHVGDTLTDGEYEFKVHHITFCGNGSLSILDERDYGWAACDVTHVQPDSWEQIIEDVRRRTSDYYCNQIPCDFGKMAEEMVARCKALAKEKTC